MDDVRLFTVEEARSALPTLKPLLAQLRDAFHEYRFARAQVDELLDMEPGSAELDTWQAKAEACDARVRASLKSINELGADVKDPILGLVDFYAKRANGQVVLLCYRDDEEDLRFWHPIDTGFAGRRPLKEL